ncbi:Borealin N terminal-domain-containing protein [Rhypophila decipiens]|uniref:Borealin N terminal-domain-containing protein n=1 Tax=Rhypophila decipiens TaxID=261697 RepID=A0AAN6Y338_9PEZI|nr:Borealin N terminal-domain-containing protein [Rhypophila decipiens]
MPPIRGKKRKSSESAMSQNEHLENTVAETAMDSQQIPTKTGSPAPGQESPLKKRRTGITLDQKAALIENLRLEIAERARKLRSSYNIQAQTLRTRLEIRLNRVPTALRNVTMGELLQKYSVEAQQARTGTLRGPPVPEKDHHSSTLGRYPLQRTANLLALASSSPAHPAKRRSREMSGTDKENEYEYIDTLKKARHGLGPAAEISRNPAQVLSPASSNSRIPPRNGHPSSSRPTTATTNTSVSPIKSGIARPVSPMKAGTIINSMVEKARATATRGNTTTTTAPATTRGRAHTTSQVIPSSSSERSRTTTTRTRGGGTASRPGTRAAGTRRVSGISESSEGSTSTVVRKRPGTAMSTKSAPGGTSSTAAGAKKNVMGTIRKGVASAAGGTTRKAPAAKTAATPASTTGTGRVLRKRA